MKKKQKLRVGKDMLRGKLKGKKKSWIRQDKAHFFPTEENPDK